MINFINLEAIILKVVIIAGGLGSRISEETHLKPKPMIEIGDRPILWHIMKGYSFFGFNDFVICLGYKGYSIKEYFHNYFLHNCDITFDVRAQSMEIHQIQVEPWRVTLVETGLATMTGGRVKQIQKYVGNEPFMLTYGDGVANVNITELRDFHFKHGKIATVTAVQPLGRFGALQLEAVDEVSGFQEKPDGDGAWINGGFFVLQPDVFDYIAGEKTLFERGPLQNLAKDRQLRAFKHTGFWQPMDTLRDKNLLEDLWQKEQAPWKVW